MRRYAEALWLGLASVAVYAGAVLLVEVSRAVGEDVSVSGMWVYVPGLAVLGYVAGQRRSPLGVMAIIAFYLVAAAAYSIVRSTLSS